MRSLDLLELPCSRFGQLELEVNLRHALEEKEGSQQKHQKKHQSHQRLKLEKGRLRVEAASSASSRSSSFSGGGDGSTILHLQDVGDMSDQEEEEDDLEDGLSKWRACRRGRVVLASSAVRRKGRARESPTGRGERRQDPGRAGAGHAGPCSHAMQSRPKADDRLTACAVKGRSLLSLTLNETGKDVARQPEFRYGVFSLQG